MLEEWLSLLSSHRDLLKISFSSCLSEKFSGDLGQITLSLLCFVLFLGFECFSLMMYNMKLFKWSSFQVMLGIYPCKVLATF